MFFIFYFESCAIWGRLLLLLSSFEICLRRGFAGQLRFCLRQDADPSSYGRCEVEEAPGMIPHPGDVLLFVKRHMADEEPTAIFAVMPAAVCAQLRSSFQQPTGVCPRRAIAEPVRKNIQTYAPQCTKQGIISKDAQVYLLGWIDQSLPRVPRPKAYPFLNLRRHAAIVEDFVPHREWAAPRRARVIQVLPAEAVSSEDEQDDGAIVFDG